MLWVLYLVTCVVFTAECPVTCVVGVRSVSCPVTCDVRAVSSDLCCAHCRVSRDLCCRSALCVLSRDLRCAHCVDEEGQDRGEGGGDQEGVHAATRDVCCGVGA